MKRLNLSQRNQSNLKLPDLNQELNNIQNNEDVFKHYERMTTIINQKEVWIWFFQLFFSLLKQFDFIIWTDWLMRWITHQQWTINLLMIITRIHPMKIRTNHPIIINKTFLQQRNHWWTHYSFRTHSERILFDLLLLH